MLSSLLMCVMVAQIAKPIPIVKVDAIEINHTKTEFSDFRQVIFWQLDDEYMRLNVTDWLMYDREKVSVLSPRDGRHRIYVRSFQGEVIVESKTLVWTEGSVDPEREDQKFVDMWARTNLVTKAMRRVR